MRRHARSLLVACTLFTCSAVLGDGGRDESCAQDDGLDATMLLQASTRASPRAFAQRAADKVSGAAGAVGRTFSRKAFIVSISPDSYEEARQRLQTHNHIHVEPAIADVSVERARGYNASNRAELQSALDLLKRYEMANKLHPTVGNIFACMHTSPGSAPHVGAALMELGHRLAHLWSPQNVDELLARDSHNCVPKVVAIAAAHVHLWEEIANGTKPSKCDGSDDVDQWFLIMEDDAALCPGALRRLERELPQAPTDADVLKLFFFGHWREEDQVKAPDGSKTPFLEVRDPLNSVDLVKASSYEFFDSFYEMSKDAIEDAGDWIENKSKAKLPASFTAKLGLQGDGAPASQQPRWSGQGDGSEDSVWKNVPVAGFYAGTQAYLISRSGARKLLRAIKGALFQDIDMTMMQSVKHYAWRRVLATSAGRREDGAEDTEDTVMLQTVPTCNREPRKDWFG